MLRLLLFLLFASLHFSGCGPSLRAIRSHIAESPYRRIAVLPFDPADQNPNSGQEAADLISMRLQEMGFIIINRSDIDKILEEQRLSVSGAVQNKDFTRLGRLLGVKAILTGTVSEASQHRIRRPMARQTISTKNIQSKGNRSVISQESIVLPEQASIMSVYSATARLTDVETGMMLWVGAGSDQGEGILLQNMAATILNRLARQMCARFYKERF